MKKIFKYLSLLIVLVIISASISFGADTISFSKAYKALNQDKGKEGYIIGKFPLIHMKDRSIGYPQVVNEARDINSDSGFTIRFELVNTEKNKKYTIFLKPVTGSDTTTYYYGREKLLEENNNEPYWVLKVPAGSYELTDFLCSLTLTLGGYQDYRKPIFDIPIAELVKRSVNFKVQEKQIVYIGDYNTTLTTYICLNKVEALYAFRKLKIEFSDNFETTKAAFLTGADDKLKEKLNEFQFVSALQ